MSPRNRHTHDSRRRHRQFRKQLEQHLGCAEWLEEDALLEQDDGWRVSAKRPRRTLPPLNDRTLIDDSRDFDCNSTSPAMLDCLLAFSHEPY